MIDKLIGMMTDLKELENSKNYVIKNIRKYTVIKKAYKCIKSNILDMKKITPNDIINYCELMTAASNLKFKTSDDKTVFFKLHSRVYPIIATITVVAKVNKGKIKYIFKSTLNENNDNTIETTWELKSDEDSWSMIKEFKYLGKIDDSSEDYLDNGYKLIGTSYYTLKNAMIIGIEILFDSIKDKYLK